MVGTGKLLAAGHMTSCCPAYISGRLPVSPPLESEILDCEDVCKKKNKKNIRFQSSHSGRVDTTSTRVRRTAHYTTLSRTSGSPSIQRTSRRTTLSRRSRTRRIRRTCRRLKVLQRGVFSRAYFVLCNANV